MVKLNGRVFLKAQNMLDSLWKYYGFDWLAMILTVAAIYQIGNKKRSGFVLMIAGNVSWICLAIMANTVAMIIANSIFIFLNIRAFVKWTKTSPKKI